MEHTINLRIGWTDAKGNAHRSVTFGKRVKLGDIIALDLNPAAQLPTQYQRLVWRQMITKFGDLVMPLNIKVLLELDAVDDDDISDAADEFIVASRDGREGSIGENEATLMFGIDIDGTNFDIVRFGNRLTVKDYVQGDKLKLGTGAARLAYNVGRQISEIANSETGDVLQGQLAVEQLSGMDSEDFNLARMSASFFRLSVPEAGEEPEGTVKSGPGDGQANGLDGTATAGSAG